MNNENYINYVRSKNKYIELKHSNNIYGGGFFSRKTQLEKLEEQFNKLKRECYENMIIRNDNGLFDKSILCQENYKNRKNAICQTTDMEYFKCKYIEDSENFCKVEKGTTINPYDENAYYQYYGDNAILKNIALYDNLANLHMNIIIELNKKKTEFFDKFGNLIDSKKYKDSKDFYNEFNIEIKKWFNLLEKVYYYIKIFMALNGPNLKLDQDSNIIIYNINSRGSTIATNFLKYINFYRSYTQISVELKNISELELPQKPKNSSWFGLKSQKEQQEFEKYEKEKIIYDNKVIEIVMKIKKLISQIQLNEFVITYPKTNDNSSWVSIK